MWVPVLAYEARDGRKQLVTVLGGQTAWCHSVAEGEARLFGNSKHSLRSAIACSKKHTSRQPMTTATPPTLVSSL